MPSCRVPGLIKAHERLKALQARARWPAPPAFPAVAHLPPVELPALQASRAGSAAARHGLE